VCFVHSKLGLSKSGRHASSRSALVAAFWPHEPLRHSELLEHRRGYLHDSADVSRTLRIYPFAPVLAHLNLVVARLITAEEALSQLFLSSLIRPLFPIPTPTVTRKLKGANKRWNTSTHVPLPAFLVPFNIHTGCPCSKGSLSLPNELGYRPGDSTNRSANLNPVAGSASDPK
jgi:hypothetical protein